MARSRTRRRRSLVEYFMAAIGLAILIFIVAVIATSRSCRVRVSPEMGIRPAVPSPTPTAKP
jgi:hypothetical protein